MPGVARLALADRGVERAHRLLERRLRVEAMRIEDVDVIEAHPLEALLEAREQVLARAPLAVGAGPLVIAGLGRDEELLAIGAQVLAVDAAEVRLGRAVGRPVVVGQVEVRDAKIERSAQRRAVRRERPVVAEVLPQAERDRRQRDPAASHAPVGHRLISGGVGEVARRLARGVVGHAASIARGDQ